jgi:hypothetical protein
LPSNRSHPLPSGGSGASSASTVWRQVATSGEPEKSARRSSRVISVRRFDVFQPIAVLAAARYWGAATTLIRSCRRRSGNHGIHRTHGSMA